jgi:hypothetical protein
MISGVSGRSQEEGEGGKVKPAPFEQIGMTQPVDVGVVSNLGPKLLAQRLEDLHAAFYRDVVVFVSVEVANRCRQAIRHFVILQETI